MMKALAQSIFSGGQQSLEAPALALGPNRYLGDRVFLVMLGVALVVHLAGFGIASLIPPRPVTDIPVRALSFKLGNGDRVTAPAPIAAPPADPLIASEAVATSPQEAVLLKPSPLPVRHVPEENRQVADTPPAIAPSPQRFIREVGAAPNAIEPASGVMMTPEAVQEIRMRYEQEISAWIERHKIYPAAAAGRSGKSIVRIRIDRMGYVRYFAIEASSRNVVLDAAAIDMIRRANPVPAVPVNYPAGALIEFLIPITFRAPA